MNGNKCKDEDDCIVNLCRTGFFQSLRVVAEVMLLFFCLSCSRQTGVKNIIHNAGNIIEQQPDSALCLLNSVLFPEDLDQSLFNKYNLLLVQAKDKNLKNIASDTIIFDVKDYYIRKKDYPNAARAAFYCGRVLHEQKNVEKAIEAYLLAEKSADKTNDDNLKGLIYGNLGILHSENSSYNRAIELNKKAVARYDKVNNYKNKINALILIGNCFLLNKQTDSAFYYYNEGLILADSCKIPDLQSKACQNIGVAYQRKKNYEQAKKLFIEALSFSVDSMEQAKIFLNIAQTFAPENKIDSVKFYLDKALLLEIQDAGLLRSSNRLLFEIEEKNGHYQEALKYHKDYLRSIIKLHDNNQKVALSDIHDKYDFEKLRDSKNLTIIKKQTVLIALSFTLLATAIVTVILILRFYRKSAQSKRILQETKQFFSKEKETSQDILIQYFYVMGKTATIESEITEEERETGNKLLKKIRKIAFGQDTLDWDKLYQILNNIQNGAYDKIRMRYPQWTEMEFRIFCLTCGPQLNDTIIAAILDTTIPMVRKIRNKLRKELNISNHHSDFINFLKNNSSISE